MSRKSLLLLLIGMIIVVPFIYFYSMRVAYLTILPFVPSGDDIAAHVYYTYQVFHDPMAGLPKLRDGRLAVPGPYPNIIHYLMSLILLFSDEPIMVAKAYGMFSFFFVITGIFLYTFIIWFNLRDKFLTLLTPILMTLLSPRAIQTLGDGSIFELFTIYIVSPLIILLNDRLFLAGFLIGLSSLNYFGIFEVILITSPFVVINFLKREKHQFIRFILGIVCGGNIFLFRFFYHILYGVVLALFLPQIPPSTPLRSSSLLPFDRYGSYMFLSNANSWIFYFALLLGVGNLLLTSYLRIKKHVLDPREKTSLLFTISWLSLIFFTFLPLLEKVSIGSSMQERILRISSQLSILPIISFTYLFRRVLQLSFLSRLISFKVIVGRGEHNKTYKFKFHKNRIIILFTSLIVLMLSFFTTPSLYAILLSNPGGLIRIDSEEYTMLQQIKGMVLKDERNIVIVAPNQVASWVLPLLTDFKRNISVVFITMTLPDNTSPWYTKYFEIYLGLTEKNEVLLKKYNVKYIVAIPPKKDQWYNDNNRKFSLYLWNEDFSEIAELVYSLQYNSGGVKVWKMR